MKDFFSSESNSSKEKESLPDEGSGTKIQLANATMYFM